MSASEALDRSSRVHHDKMSLLRDVQQLESDLHTYKLEIDRLNVELEGERSKRKEMYAAKLTSDRQLAELMAGKYKIEVISFIFSLTVFTMVLIFASCYVSIGSIR